MPEETTPTARVNFHAEDKIGIPGSYSSITYGLSISRDVPDEGIESIREAANELMVEVESFLGEERERILGEFQGTIAKIN